VVSQAIQKIDDTVTKPAERFYLPELDVLRFFAFFAVFVSHMAPYAFYSHSPLGALGEGGAFGVDLFFTLSGYLLTSLLLREREKTGHIDVKAFYVRRGLRIWPLYYFFLALCFLLTLIPESFIPASIYPGDLFVPIPLKSYFFMAIFLFNFNFAGSMMTNPSSFMTQLWTISVEEQFYLFWPWIVRYVPRRRLVAVPVAMIAISCIARATLPLNPDRHVWTNTLTRLDPIAVGILIALMPRLTLRPALRLVLVLAGFACWEFASYYCGLIEQLSIAKVSMGYPAVALGSGACLLAILGAKSFRSEAAPVRFLVYLGKISYGLYVYSQIAIYLAKLLLFQGELGALESPGHPSSIEFAIFWILAFCFNVALAAASYRWLEAPFLRLKERFARVPSRAV
jgi:peptidoglycan/LPS O-acetylase OafA/YrhL